MGIHTKSNILIIAFALAALLTLDLAQADPTPRFLVDSCADPSSSVPTQKRSTRSSERKIVQESPCLYLEIDGSRELVTRLVVLPKGTPMYHWSTDENIQFWHTRRRIFPDELEELIDNYSGNQGGGFYTSLDIWDSRSFGEKLGVLTLPKDTLIVPFEQVDTFNFRELRVTRPKLTRMLRAAGIQGSIQNLKFDHERKWLNLFDPQATSQFVEGGAQTCYQEMNTPEKLLRRDELDFLFGFCKRYPLEPDPRLAKHSPIFAKLLLSQPLTPEEKQELINKNGGPNHMRYILQAECSSHEFYRNPTLNQVCQQLKSEMKEFSLLYLQSKFAKLSRKGIYDAVPGSPVLRLSDTSDFESEVDGLPFYGIEPSELFPWMKKEPNFAGFHGYPMRVEPIENILQSFGLLNFYDYLLAATEGDMNRYAHSLDQVKQAHFPSNIFRFCFTGSRGESLSGNGGNWARISEFQKQVLDRNPYLVITEMREEPQPSGTQKSYLIKYEHPDAKNWQHFRDKLSPQLVSRLASPSPDEEKMLTQAIVGELFHHVVAPYKSFVRSEAMADIFGASQIQVCSTDNELALRADICDRLGIHVFPEGVQDLPLLSFPEFVVKMSRGKNTSNFLRNSIYSFHEKNPNASIQDYFQLPEIWQVATGIDIPLQSPELFAAAVKQRFGQQDIKDLIHQKQYDEVRTRLHSFAKNWIEQNSSKRKTDEVSDPERKRKKK